MKIKIEIDRHETSDDWIVRVIGEGKNTIVVASGSHKDRDVASSFALRSFDREVARARKIMIDFGASDSPEMLNRMEER